MARVPTYDEFQVAPQVAQAGRAEASVTPQMMSVSGEQMQSLGRGMQGAGDAMSRIVMDVQKDINEAATREADTAFTMNANRVMSDYLNKSGKSAVVDQQGTQKAILETAQSSGDGLQNDMQRRMYHEVASRRLQQVIGQVNMHAATQAKQWNITETKARSENSANDMAANWYQWKDDFADLRHTSYDENSFGDRPDGTKKGTGFLGVLKTANGNAMTEYSIGVKIDGKEMDVPTMVPTLNRSEVKTLLNLKDGEKIPEAIVQKAVDHAKQRIADGKSVFAEEGEGPAQESNRYTQARSTAIAEIDALVKLQTGADPDSDIAIAARRDFLTGAHANVIQKMITGNDARTARDYLDAAERRGEIDSAKSKPLHDMVKTANVSDEALKLTMSMTGGPQSKLQQLDKLYAEGRVSVEVFKEARGEVEHRWQLQKAAESDYEKSIKGKATDWAIHNPNASILDFQKANPVVYTYMMNHGQLDDLDRVIKSGGKVSNDAATWADVMTNQQELKNLTPTQIYNQYSMKLDESHLEKLYAIHSALNGSKDEQHLSIFSTAEMVKDSAVRMAILPTTGKPNDTQTKDFNQFQMALDAKIAAYEAHDLGGKRKASQQELKKILQDVEMDKVYKSRSGMWDKSDVPMVTMKPEDYAKAYVKVGDEEISLATIPPTQRALIIPALRKAGQPVTEQNIANYWVRLGKQK